MHTHIFRMTNCDNLNINASSTIWNCRNHHRWTIHDTIIPYGSWWTSDSCLLSRLLSSDGAVFCISVKLVSAVGHCCCILFFGCCCSRCSCDSVCNYVTNDISIMYGNRRGINTRVSTNVTLIYACIDVITIGIPIGLITFSGSLRMREREWERNS